MFIKEFETEVELDEEFEKLEEVNMEHQQLRENVDQAIEHVDSCQFDLEIAFEQLEAAKSDLFSEESTLEDFEEDHKETLI